MTQKVGALGSKTGDKQTETESDEPLSLQHRALAAAAAGTTGAALSTVACYPIELVKNRLQAAAMGKAGYQYKSMSDGLRSILREEGVRGLYVGLGPILARCFISDFATFYFSEMFLGIAQQPSTGVAALPLRIAGASVSTIISLPIENISTRVTVTMPAIGSGEATRQLWSEGGFRAFWRGAQVMQILCINPALTMCSFDWLRRLYVVARRQFSVDSKEILSYLEAFVVGAVAKLLTLCLVYPLIRGKFLLQARNSAGLGLLEVLGQVYKSEGLGSLYLGLDAQLSKSLLSTALQFATKERTESQWRAFLSRR